MHPHLGLTKSEVCVQRPEFVRRYVAAYFGQTNRGRVLHRAKMPGYNPIEVKKLTWGVLFAGVKPREIASLVAEVFANVKARKGGYVGQPSEPPTPDPARE